MCTSASAPEVSACEKGGAWQHALQLLGDLGRFSVEADTLTYEAAYYEYHYE